MHKILSILFVAAAIAASSIAQSSRGAMGVSLDQSTHVVRDADTLHSVRVPVLIPRWDGRDDSGVAHEAHRLRAVQLEARVRLETEVAGENRAQAPVGRWRHETGVKLLWHRGGATYGGGSLTTYTAGGHALAAFDGAVDAAGASGWSWSGAGSPQMHDIAHVGTRRQDLRAWCGAGDVLLELEPVPVSLSRGLPGHWIDLSTIRVAVLDVSVRYFIDGAPISGAWTIEHGPWVEHALLEGGDVADTLDLPGPSDPSRVLATWYEYAHEEHRWLGIENLAPFAATCGGSAHGGVHVSHESGGLSGLHSNASSGVGTFAPVQAWDGATDWSGSSGVESWGSGYLTHVYRSPRYFGAGWWTSDAQLAARPSHAIIAPQSLTPGADFAWDGAWRFTGRVRAVRIVAP